MSLRSRILDLAFGDFAALSDDPIAFFESAAQRGGSPARLRLGPKTGWLVTDADQARTILVRDAEIFRKGMFVAKLRRVLGSAVFTTDGEEWTRRRAMLQPAFRQDALSAAVEAMTAAARATVERLACASDTPAGNPADVAGAMPELALRMAVAALLDHRLVDDAAVVRLCASVDEIQAFFARSMWRLVDIDLLLPTPANKRFTTALREAEGVVAEVISRMRALAAQGERPAGVAGLLLDADLTDREIRDEVMTMLIAGHETTASASAWMLHAMASRPSVLQGIRNEVQRLACDSSEIGYSALPRMTYTKAVVDETLRLFPSAYWMSREATKDAAIGGTAVRKGDIVLLSPWCIQRDPQRWEEANCFKPERFLGDGGRAGFLPFGFGPRACIGGRLAVMEMQIIAASFAAALDLSTDEDIDAVRPTGGVTLRPPTGRLMVHVAQPNRVREAAA